MRKIAIAFATAALLASAALAQDEMAVLNFIVIRDYGGKPIRNASVVIRWEERQAVRGLQIKTDPDGNSFDGVPFGKLRVQGHRFPDVWRGLLHRQGGDGSRSG
jgi:hypothetical protein